jgi:DNA repair protein RadA/Sms
VFEGFDPFCSQVRECANALLQVAKRTGVAIFLVGHVTKAGDIAGPRVLEHIVDTVLYMEGERLQALRWAKLHRSAACSFRFLS